MSFVKEFFQFIGERKKFWMVPLIVVTLVIGTLLVVAQGSALAPFIYTLF